MKKHSLAGNRLNDYKWNWNPRVIKPQSMWILAVLRCISGPNFEILSYIIMPHALKKVKSKQDSTWRLNVMLKKARYHLKILRFRINEASCSCHYNDVKVGAIASQITSLAIVYSIVYSEADQRKHQSSASLAFVRGIHRVPVNSLHKWPVEMYLSRHLSLWENSILPHMLRQCLIWQRHNDSYWW